MKIGEIKAQAIMLMYPDVSLSFDEADAQDVERAIYELKLDPNFEGVLKASVGSINRALSYIDGQGYGETKCVDISSADCQKTRDGRVLIKMPQDLLRVEDVLCYFGTRAKRLCFEVRGKDIITECKSGTYTVIYKRITPRIKSTSADSGELEISNSLAEIIPYFIAGELFKQENPEASTGFFEYFQRSVASHGEMKAPCHRCFEAVYSME